MIKFPEGRKVRIAKKGNTELIRLDYAFMSDCNQANGWTVTEGVFLTTAEYEQIKQAVADEREKVLEELRSDVQAIWIDNECCNAYAQEVDKAIRAMKQPNHNI